ncbi:hypothetical protein [Anaerotalea alkaliphila]|uniref:Uncharacterized protein n=1 Tax=Anaerotalea alkaliphila TaxID=2662126 RepID=A0A7X5KM91_9FIRM|nr:hypothetical protein [Anaerotalea alkaliphila]NDL66468.1 hypothetical protein [Anaerotalea alkaliphila]
MKKFILLLLLGAVGLLGACGGGRPEDAVEKFFSDTRRFDLEGMRSGLAAGEAHDLDDMLLEENPDSLLLLEYLKGNAAKMTYNVIGAAVEGNKATVTVETRYVDAQEIYLATLQEYNTRSMELVLGGEEQTEDVLTRIFMEILLEKAGGMEERFKEATLEIPCVKQDGEWLIAGMDDDLADVFLSNLVTAGHAMEEEWGDVHGEVEEGSGKDAGGSARAGIDGIHFWLVGEVWPLFSEFQGYLEVRKGASGRDLEVEMEIPLEQLAQAMAMKPAHDGFIAGLGEGYGEVQAVWMELSREMDKIHGGITGGAETIDTLRFQELMEAFGEVGY